MYLYSTTNGLQRFRCVNFKRKDARRCTYRTHLLMNGSKNFPKLKLPADLEIIRERLTTPSIGAA